MHQTSIQAPTPDQIDAAIRAAHQARAVALRSLVSSAAHWIAHPHFGHRTA